MPNVVTRNIPYGAQVIILFVLAITVLVLVILNTFSSPFINSINFLRLPSPSGDTTFGSFGWCSPGFCLPNQVAYEYGTQVNHSLTGAMLLWAIAVIFAVFTLVSILPLLFVHESRALRFVGNRAFFLFSSNLAWIIVTTAWLFSVFGWSIAHRAFQVTGAKVHLGDAIWMGLAAAISITLLVFLGWPADAWDGTATRAAAGAGRGNGYYHYKRSTRQVVPR